MVDHSLLPVIFPWQSVKLNYNCSSLLNFELIFCCNYQFVIIKFTVEKKKICIKIKKKLPCTRQFSLFFGYFILLNKLRTHVLGNEVIEMCSLIRILAP